METFSNEYIIIEIVPCTLVYLYISDLIQRIFIIFMKAFEIYIKGSARCKYNISIISGSIRNKILSKWIKLLESQLQKYFNH